MSFSSMLWKKKVTPQRFYPETVLALTLKDVVKFGATGPQEPDASVCVWRSRGSLRDSKRPCCIRHFSLRVLAATVTFALPSSLSPSVKTTHLSSLQLIFWLFLISAHPTVSSFDIKCSNRSNICDGTLLQISVISTNDSQTEEINHGKKNNGYKESTHWNSASVKSKHTHASGTFSAKYLTGPEEHSSYFKQQKDAAQSLHVCCTNHQQHENEEINLKKNPGRTSW